MFGSSIVARKSNQLTRKFSYEPTPLSSVAKNVPKGAFSYERSAVHPDVLTKLAFLKHHDCEHISNVPRSISKKLFEWDGFGKFGLFRDDLWNEFPNVQEALLRIPKIELEKRTDRIRQATVHNSQHYFLPEEEWVSFEEQVPYLTPYVMEIISEKDARRQFRYQT